MHRSRLAAAVLLTLFVAIPGRAQQEVPNAMSSHTVFVIVITGAFLVWAASYSVHFIRDRADRSRDHADALAARRDSLLDEIAALESEHDAGTISDARHKNRMKTLRNELARTLVKLEAASAGSRGRGARAARRRA